ncbi:TetR/AcrR family transcriptional regulator [uncultured Aquimarina sp.]|uniref:TetR/AcrR family transcriptional regulator n=1 Tax=uncultured Aquimarina sp. TaxID=575652 RepID=UPI00260E13FF|nr:TetR/AcrR family transcriptional regulator [uncultured Aquimarina sp.]
MNIKHNKEDILRKGMELFRLNGYHNTGTNEIIKEAGISRGSFYNFFKDKDDFGIQVLDFYGVWSTDYMKQLLNDKKLNPKQRLINMFDEFVEGYKKENYKWGCLLVGMTQELGQINSAFTEACNRNFESFLNVFEPCIKEGQQDGTISKNEEARALAITVLSMYNGALVLMKSGLHHEPLTAFQGQLKLMLAV